MITVADIEAKMAAKLGGKFKIVADHRELEASGWRNWLMTLFPFWFSSEFSEDHVRYWDLRWSVLKRYQRQKEVWNHYNDFNRDEGFEKLGISVSTEEMTVMLLLGRGLAKSSSIEAARIMYGALMGGGYSLMVSETDDQAQEHLGNCRILIESLDSKLLEYYPGMAIANDADALQGMPTADRKEMFICKNGFILRAKGLKAKMRGLRVGEQRPSEIALDDIDDVNDSLAVSKTKLATITQTIVPVFAKRFLILDFAQNLIGEHSVANQLRLGKAEGISQKTVIGPTPAFTHLEIEYEFDSEGRSRPIISPLSIASWSGLSIKTAQQFLDNSGLGAFRAEYQNEFDQFKAGRVIPEYNEDAQIITWSQFESVFGERRIPSHWMAKAGLDVGYSEGQYPHYSAWDFFATSAMNSPYPGLVFLYRSLSFQGTSIDDQAEQVRSQMWNRENVTEWQMSHERTGEMMTLNQKYGFLFSKFRYYKAEDGVAQWRHLSRVDPERYNPFTDDSGCPSLFYIVDDDQKHIARDDKGLKLFRDQVSTWEYVPVKITESGQTVQKPSKINDDHCDCAKGILALFGSPATALTTAEKIYAAMPEDLREENIKSSEQRMAQVIRMEKEIEKVERRRNTDEWEFSR